MCYARKCNMRAVALEGSCARSLLSRRAPADREPVCHRGRADEPHPRGAQPAEHRSLFAASVAVPVEYDLIALDGRPVLVDACYPEFLAHVGEPVTDGLAAACLLYQLAIVGVAAPGMDTLIIIHLHFDH